MKRKKKLCRILIAFIAVIAAAAIVLVGQFFYRSPAENRKRFETENAFITGRTAVSAHRSGAGNFPEETLAAFRGCAEDESFTVDYFEFDLHMTADGVPVLSHDETLDRVSDAEEVFGTAGVTVGEKTLAELKTLNMAAQFVNDAGETPYADLHGDSVPDDLRILTLDEVLDYLTAAGDYRYIIEIKDGGDTGRAAADYLCAALAERDLVDRVIIGTFQDDVSDYLTEAYPDTHRSAGPEEVLQFVLAALTGKEDFTCDYDVLQLPFNDAKESYGINLGLAKFINYAHANNLAIQYWTVNDEEDMRYLASLGADALITDYPDRAAALLAEESAE